VRTLWLVVPAIIVGANGSLFFFCAVTNMWDVWAVLWTIEPLSAGLALMVVRVDRRVSPWLFWAGAITCGLAGLGLVGMTTIISDWWWINLSGPVILMLAGFLMLAWDVVRRATAAGATVE